MTTNPLHFIRMYFNCAYYFGMFPFRFKYCNETGKYIIVKNLFQKIVWLIVFILTASNSTYEAVNEYTLQNSSDYVKTPVLYFRRANLMSDTVLLVIILLTQCTRSEQFLKAINTMHETSSYNSNNKSYFQILSLPFLFFVLWSIALSFVLHYFVLVSWNFNEGIDLLRTDGMSQIFLDSFNIPDSTFFTIIFATFRILTVLAYGLYMTCGEVLLLGCSCSMNSCLNSFNESIRNKDVDGNEAYQQFMALKQVANNLNDAVGLLIFGVVFALLPYFVVTFVSLVNPSDTFEFIISGLELGTLYAFLCFAAIIGRNANIINDKFIHTKDLSELSLYQVNSILYDINSHFVEFNCGGFCNLSPGFLGGMIQLLLTFSVILIQFQLPQ